MSWTHIPWAKQLCVSLCIHTEASIQSGSVPVGGTVPTAQEAKFLPLATSQHGHCPFLELAPGAGTAAPTHTMREPRGKQWASRQRWQLQSRKRTPMAGQRENLLGQKSKGPGWGLSLYLRHQISVVSLGPRGKGVLKHVPRISTYLCTHICLLLMNILSCILYKYT